MFRLEFAFVFGLGDLVRLVVLYVASSVETISGGSAVPRPTFPTECFFQLALKRHGRGREMSKRLKDRLVREIIGTEDVEIAAKGEIIVSAVERGVGLPSVGECGTVDTPSSGVPLIPGSM